MNKYERPLRLHSVRMHNSRGLDVLQGMIPIPWSMGWTVS